MVAYYIAVCREKPADWDTVMQPYFRQVQATMALYGGGYRAGFAEKSEVVEGDWGETPGYTVVEFPTYEQLRAWYYSLEYAPLKALRNKHMRFDVLLLDGLGAAEIAERARIAQAEARQRWGDRVGRSEAPGP